MNQEKEKLDAAIKNGLVYEKFKLKWHLGHITEYSNKSHTLTTIKDSILQIIDTTSLFQDPYDQKKVSSILNQLSKIDSSFNISAKKGESNISLVSRSIEAYLNAIYEELGEELVILLKRIDIKDEKSLTVGIAPFKNIKVPGTKIYFKDSLIASSVPFGWAGDPNGLKLEFFNSVTRRKSYFVY